ncbi:MAG: sigma-70 family RNA polymerase sigma factor [Cyclobacteriaceae bacterium]|nr:sigma-70 family RNA polymerase sigma factor [Cyclobacteriaceae bacterium SS2]
MERTNQVFEELLVLNARNGDAQAINLLVKRWNGRIRNQVYRHTQNAEVSGDISQEVWIAIFKSINTLQDVRKFGVWALSIASRKAIDWIRRNQVDRKREGIREMVATEMAEDSGDDQEMLIRRLRQALKSLPEDQRVILSLYYLEELAVPDIATILSIPAGTVKSRLYYARENLKQIIKAYEKREEH